MAFRPGREAVTQPDAHLELLSFPARRRDCPQAHSTSGPALQRLSDHLLSNYKKDVRPVRDWREPTTVSIDVIVYAILSVVSAAPVRPNSR